MLLVSGGQGKFFYDYVPLDAPTRSREDHYSYEFTTRNLGIPDGTTIEFILDDDEKDVYTYVSPLIFRYESASDPYPGVYYEDSLVVWEENGSFYDSLLLFYYVDGIETGGFHAKWRYSY